jgi:hypothetical protein
MPSAPPPISPSHPCPPQIEHINTECTGGPPRALKSRPHVRRTHIGETARKGGAGVRALLLGATELAKGGNLAAEGLRERHGGQT